MKILSAFPTINPIAADTGPLWIRLQAYERIAATIGITAPLLLLS
jgi:hypothetical protein